MFLAIKILFMRCLSPWWIIGYSTSISLTALLEYLTVSSEMLLELTLGELASIPFKTVEQTSLAINL